jgi:ADP-ribose pyrophosphatase
MDLTERTVKSEKVYRGRIVDVRMDDVAVPDGKIVKREVVEHPGGVVILALDESGRVAAVRQYRYAVRGETLELPAGKLERGEEPREAALRELREETGAVPDEFTSLGTFFSSPGIFTETIHAFLARGLAFGETHPDEDEFLAVERVPFDKMYEMIKRGEICDMKTVAVFLKAKALLGK